MAKEILAPAAEQLAAFELAEIVDKRRGGVTVTLGKAYRRRRMIDVLRETGLLSADEHKALSHYRHHADIADRSPLRDSIATLLMVRGSGDEPSLLILNAMRVRDDCEKAAGSLRGILRAVVVDDVSLSQWAIADGGGVEVQRADRKGTTIRPLHSKLKRAKLDIQMAAKRVMAELDA